LTQSGHNDIAYRLLLSDTFPSWGYSIKYGATTIWERWDGYTKEHGFQDPKMNSFNHYSLGSVGRWLYQYVAGIDTDENEVGFSKIIIRPNPAKGLTYVRSEYKSINGLIKNSWEIIGNQFVMNVCLIELYPSKSNVFIEEFKTISILFRLLFPSIQEL